MADLAKELLRTTVRAFYSTEAILVVDALILHSTMQDQELSAACGTQPKQVRRTCGQLKEEGLLSVQVRAERRADGSSGYHAGGTQAGKERFTNRDWYYLNFHHAIDSIKFKMYRLTKHFETLGMPTTERKDYNCPRCKNQYTDLEAVEYMDPSTGNFICQRCGQLLDQIAEEDIANENESIKRLNQQLEKLTRLLQKIDSTTVPENDFLTALDNRVPLIKSDSNPGSKVEVIDVPNKNLQSTKGLQIQPEKISVQVQDDEEVKREKAATEAKEKKERDAKQNSLPVWHTQSTVVPGDITVVGAKEEFERKQREADMAIIKEEGAPESKASTADNDVMAAYWEELEREKAAEKAREAEEDDEEDDDEEDEFEDVVGGGNTPANGVNGRAPTSTGMNTPNVESSNATDDERDAKRVRIEEPISNGARQAQKTADTPAASDEDEDELEFENV